MVVEARLAMRAARHLQVGGGRVVAAVQAHLAGICSFALIASIGVGGGGYARPLLWHLGTLAVLALAAAALLARERIALTRAHLALLGALVALAGWTVLSTIWSSAPEGSLREAERTALYCAAVFALLVGLERADVPQLLAGVVAGLTFVSLYGLGPYVFSRPPLDPVQGDLLFQPAGYSNTMGICAALGLILSLGLVLSSGGRRRLVAMTPPLVLAPALYFTSSRGAFAALLVGVVFALFAARYIRSPALLLVLTVVAVVIGLVAGSERGQAASLLGENRPDYWRVAWQDYEARPLLGSGAGSFGTYWREHRPSSTAELVQDAHNLYLEMLAELGPLGLLLVGTALAMPLLALRGRQTALTAAAAGAYVAFLLHAAVDWDWEMPVVSLSGLVTGGAILAGRRGRGTRPLSQRARTALLAIALVALALTLARLGIVR